MPLAPLHDWLAGEWRHIARALTYGPTLALLLPALPALLLLYQFPHPRAIEVGRTGDERYLRGFYGREDGPGGDYRWTWGHGQLVLPAAPGNSAWRVTLWLSGARPPGTVPPPLEVLAGEQVVARFDTDLAAREYSFDVARAPLPARDLVLTLRTPTFQPPGDARALGVQLDRATLVPRRGAGPLPFFLPPPAYAAGVLALLAGVAALLGRLGLGRRAVAALVAAALVALFAGVALTPDATALAVPKMLAAVALALAAIAARRPLLGLVAPWRALRARAVARPLPWLGAVLGGGLALRLTLAPLTSYRYDIDIMRGWAVRLVTLPLARFYDTTALVDHLPGDLWFLWAIAQLHRALWPGAGFDTTAFLVLLKLVPALADIGIGALLFLLGRRLRGPGAGLLAAFLFTFNPATLFVTAIWGQWDAVSACAALAALWLLLRGNVEWSFPVLTYAALIKPPLAALAPLFAIRAASDERRAMNRSRGEGRGARGAGRTARRSPLVARRFLLALAASLLVLVVVPLPFDVGLPGTPVRWSIVERALAALDRYTYTSYSAFNLWTTPPTDPPGAPLFKQPDGVPWLLGLSYRAWAMLLLGGAYAGIVGWYWRRGRRLGDGPLVWACLATMYALFVLPTRVHERYIFPALVFAALATALAPRLAPLYAGMTLVSLANLYYVYAQFFAPPRYRFAWLYRPDLFVHLMSLLNVALLLCALLWAPRLLARDVGPPVAEPMPDGEAADRVAASDRDAAIATRPAGRSA